MLTRFGANELKFILIYTESKKITYSNFFIKSFFYVIGKQPKWWLNKNIIHNMNLNVGFFPNILDYADEYCSLFFNDIKEIDILCNWLDDERFIKKEIQKFDVIHLHSLEPFWNINPWTNYLKNKKVLVIHPFADLIKYQYQYKDKIFPNKILPDFKLLTIKAYNNNSTANNNNFNSWFEALDDMKKQIDQFDFDICLIGCGGFGIHLAAHVKRKQRISIHIGGALQLFFGIYGNRWLNPNYGVKEWNLEKNKYINLYNDFWTRPLEIDKPQNHLKIENSCYW
jgi:hypothetical protein